VLLLAAFAAIALLAAGCFAVLKGDTFIFITLLVALIVVVLVAAPHALLLMTELQHAIDATVPLALR
jgi:hypothetical protein